NLPNKNVIGVDNIRSSFDKACQDNFNVNFNIDFDINTSILFLYKNIEDINHKQNIFDKNIISTDNIRCSLDKACQD
ncbi:18718_t:CDS:2, partial [Gigaspora rosea]